MASSQGTGLGSFPGELPLSEFLLVYILPKHNQRKEAKVR